MDDGLKQRIVGAVVLIALIVIFLPLLFDEDRITPLDRTTRIPLEPKIEAIEINKPEPAADSIAEPVKESTPEEATAKPAKRVVAEPVLKVEPDKAFIPDETRPQTLVDETPGLSETGIPKSWVLQIASFSDRARAIAMRDNLLNDRYDAYVREVSTNKGLMIRVYVGPKLNKNTLIKLKQTIDKKYKLSAIILRHNL